MGLDLLGENALLHAGLGYTSFRLAHIVPGAMAKQMNEAEASARPALDLDADLVTGHVKSGLVDWKKGVSAVRSATSARPWRIPMWLDDALEWGFSNVTFAASDGTALGRLRGVPAFEDWKARAASRQRQVLAIARNGGRTKMGGAH